MQIPAASWLHAAIAKEPFLATQPRTELVEVSGLPARIAEGISTNAQERGAGIPEESGHPARITEEMKYYYLLFYLNPLFGWHPCPPPPNC